MKLLTHKSMRPRVCTRAVSVSLAASVLLSVVGPYRASAGPLRKQNWKHSKKSVVHQSKTQTTKNEFHDDDAPGCVRGKITGVTQNPPTTGAITAFTIRTTVTNNSSSNWAGYVIAFEFAQHANVTNLNPPATTTNHWHGEGYDPTNAFGPQPVINLSSPGNTIWYSEFTIPKSTTLPDIPAVVRAKPIKNTAPGNSDSFLQNFTIPGAGALPSSKLGAYLITAARTGADIFWARKKSKGISDYPEPLASKAGSTLFDPTGGVGSNPKNDSNVSVFPVLSKRKSSKAKGKTSARFYPANGALTIDTTTISAIELVDDPDDPVFASDLLQGADFIVEGLVLGDSQGDGHFFTDGQLRIEKAGEVYLQGDLNLFLSVDLPADPVLLRTFGMLEDLAFPQGTAGSKWLSDIAAELAADASLSLDFAFEPTSGESYAQIISDALLTQTPAVTEVDVECVGNGVVEDTKVAIPTVTAWGLVVMTLLLAGGAKIYFGRRRRSAKVA